MCGVRVLTDTKAPTKKVRPGPATAIVRAKSPSGRGITVLDKHARGTRCVKSNCYPHRVGRPEASNSNLSQETTTFLLYSFSRELSGGLIGKPIRDISCAIALSFVRFGSDAIRIVWSLMRTRAANLQE